RRLHKADRIRHELKADDMRDAQRDEAHEVERLLLNPNREEDNDVLRQRKARLTQLGDPTGDVDSAATLALLFDTDDKSFERLNKYEQRLQYTITRSLRELRQLRKDAEHMKDLRPSIYSQEVQAEEMAASEDV